MIDLLLPTLNPEDIRRICDNALLAMSKTDQCASSTSIADIHAQQTEIEKSISGLDQIINVIDREIGRLKNTLEAVESMKKDLSRHDKRLTRCYWQLKNAQPKN